MRRAFVTHELLVPIALLAIMLGICLPILEAMRASRLSPWLGILSIVLVCACFIVPWWLNERAGRRDMDRLMSKKDLPREDDA